MKATLSNHRQPPRKVRLIADLIRGKSVPRALDALRFLPKKSTPMVEKLLNSAVANARSAGHTPEELFVKKITVDKGAVMRRYRPFARGRSGTLRKILSIISIELGTVPTAEKAKSTKKPAKKAEKKS